MTYVHIKITINEAQIRDETIKLYKKTKDYLWQNYYQTYIRAKATGLYHGSSPLVAGVHKLVGHIEQEYTGPRHTNFCKCCKCKPLEKKHEKPVHTILCNCRNCRPSHYRFRRAILENKAWY